MLQQVSEMIYLYIRRCEMFMLRYYKVNPFEIMKSISMLDLNYYMLTIQHEEKKEQEGMKKNDIMKCLKGANQYLNMMFYNK